MRKPTKLQKATVEILKENPDMPVGAAMRKAGYSPKTALNPSSNLMDTKGAALAMDQWRDMLRGSGLNEDWLVKKYKEWGEATKIQSSMTEPDRVVPDYQTQLKVKDDLRRDLGLGVVQDPNLKRKLTIEEWINND